MQFITIRLNNSETGQDEEQARRKTLEALDDLISELCIQLVDKEATLKAYLAAGQGLVSLIRSTGKEILVGEDVSLYAEEFIRQQNDSHIERRGWSS